MVDIPLENSITRNWMTGTKQLIQILLPTREIGGTVKNLMGIVNPFLADTENCTDPTIKPTIDHFKQVTIPRYSYQNHLSIVSLNSGIDVPALIVLLSF